MENANLFVPIPPNGLRPMITQELNDLCIISAMIDSCFENINHTQIIIPPHVPFEQLLNDFMNPTDVFELDDLESRNELVDTPLVSPFIDLDEELDDGEVLNELNEYGNAGNFYHDSIIFSIERDDLAFPCMIGFRKFVAYFDPFLPMNIITFTYVTDFIVLEDMGEFIIRDMSEVVMGRPFRSVTQLEYDCLKSLISFTRIFDTYIFWMPRTIPRLKDFSWSKVPPILVLSHRDLMSRLSIWEAFGRKARDLKVKLLIKFVTSQSIEPASGFAMTSSRVKGNGVTTTSDAVAMTDKEKPLEDSTG
ncbi:hypothetical protein Tco_0266894 [Tanacetum coccineum]